jgi:hypothetical protein
MEQIGVRACIDQRPARGIGRHLETLRPAAEQPALRLAGEKEAREPPGQRRLADATRAGQQPGVVQPTAAVRRQQRLLGRRVTNQPVAAPGRRPVVRPFELLEVARIGARLASRHG